VLERSPRLPAVGDHEKPRSGQGAQHFPWLVCSYRTMGF
jgi:hypothetical protein